MKTKKSSKKQTTSRTEKCPAKRHKVVSLSQYEAERKAAGAAQGGKSAAEAAKDAARPEKPTTAKRGGKGGKRASGLDAAAQVLAEAGEPLNTKTMVERMLAKGYWTSNGKTPAATIYSAILREIKAKGDGSRFRKADRGKFGLAR
ncbi:MAG TPA: winged helix-turn-helix domain-containing protein [Phycisphaerae bacterium]|nr:winged helix-turn-helix domain-containing protein [Phycisphaerae bacterium]HUT60758.1 winged helix-turn-helix domain-containing protein [Phycisphaerae bacterium]